MMRFFWILFFSAVLVSAATANEINVAAGIEYFQWKEFDEHGRELLDETGPRYFVSLAGRNPMEKDWIMDFSGRIYTGTVDYDGETQEPNVQPVKTDTFYSGLRIEFGLSHEFVKENGTNAFRIAAGLDQWARDLQDSFLQDGTRVYGYTERYDSFYIKVGAHHRGAGGVSIGLGAKLPFYTREEIDFGYGMLYLSPKGQFSLFADMEFPLDQDFSLALGYDSYRFAKSDPVVVGSYLYWQPESTQDTFSLALRYRF